MGSQVSTKEKVSAEEKAIVNVWSFMLDHRGIKCDKKDLHTLLQWCRNHGVDASIEAAFLVKIWERAGELIFESASRGDDTAKNIKTTWKRLLDTLKLLELEQNAKPAAEAPQTPPAKTPSDGGAQEGALGGVGATSSSRVERAGEKAEGKQLSSAPAIPATPPAPCAPAPPRPAPPVSTKPSSPPLPMHERSDDKLLPTAPPGLDGSNRKLGMAIGAGSRAALGADSSSRELPAPRAAGCHTSSCPQPKPEKPKESPLLVDLWNPNRGGPSCRLPAGPDMQPVSATISGYDRVTFWQYRKLKAIANGDLQLAEQLSDPYPRLFLSGQELVSGTTGAAISAYNPVSFWQRMKFMALANRDYEVAEQISVPWFPHSLDDQEGQNNGTASFIQVAFKILTQLRQLATQHGLGSAVVTRMLRLLAECEMTPFDVKQIAGLLCAPKEYVMFEFIWKEKVERQGLHSLAVPQQDPCFGAGVSQLLGWPPVNNPQLQARLNPWILAKARDLGMQALMEVGKMALVTPTQSCVKIKQSPKEPYMQFIERLKDAIEKQIANDEAKYLLIQALARSNANEDCKKAIDLLPEINPSLDEMIDACADVGTVSFEMTRLADYLAAALRLYTCYGCGQLGHRKANCPRRYNSWGTHQKWRTVPVVGNCYRCGKPGHFAKQCRSKFHANGQPLGGQGNWNRSPKGRCLQA
uniref:CCHC-type domain-containing protein n=1 Tax=Junco hyemalis TaxID=40217 RepID=A0A8C5ITU3_JUNHY